MTMIIIMALFCTKAGDHFTKRHRPSIGRLQYVVTVDQIKEVCG